MVHETTTSLAPTAVLAQARQFFAERVPHRPAYPEKAGPSFLTLRGQGGEEVALSAVAGEGATRVRASTLLFDQEVSRFFSTLPAAAQVVA